MWAVFAVCASVFWGIVYALDEQIFKHISFYTSFAIATALATVVFIALALTTGSLHKDVGTLMTNRWVLVLTLASAVAFLIAHILIALSIIGKNATVAGLIEISYPLFIIIATYLLFRESHLSLGTAAGGALIAAGVAVIYLTSK